MVTKEFKAMTRQELEDHKLSLKQQIDALHEEARAASAIHAAKVLDEHVERARESMQAWADENGKTLDEAIAWWEGRLTPNGDKGRWVQSLLLQGKPGKVPF